MSARLLALHFEAKKFCIQSDECVSKAFAVVLPSFEETAGETRPSMRREALHSGGVDVHSFM